MDEEALIMDVAGFAPYIFYLMLFLIAFMVMRIIVKIIRGY